MNRNKSGFTLVELLVVVAIIALLIGLLLPALGRAQRAAKTLNDAANIGQIHKGFLTYSNADPKGYLPLPGLIRRAAVPGVGPGGAAAFVPGQGEEQQNQNNSANLYSAMIAKNFVTPDVLFSPVEENPVVRQMTNYNFQAYNPAAPAPTRPAPATPSAPSTGIRRSAPTSTSPTTAPPTASATPATRTSR